MMRRATVAAVIAASFAAGIVAHAAAGTSPGSPSGIRYARTTPGTRGVEVVVLRGCTAEDDFGAGLRLVDYTGHRAVLRCRPH